MCDLVGIPPERQTLIYGGKKLRNRSSLDECNVPEGGTLHLALELAGGGCTQSTKKEDEERDEVTFHDISGSKDSNEAVRNKMGSCAWLIERFSASLMRCPAA